MRASDKRSFRASLRQNNSKYNIESNLILKNTICAIWLCVARPNAVSCRSQTKAMKLMKKTVKDQIMDAARASFHAKGIAETGVEELAAAVGLSRRSFYRYFRGLDDVITQMVLAQGKRDLAEALTKSRSHAASDAPWAHFVFHAVRINRGDAFWTLVREQHALATNELFLARNPKAFAEFLEVVLPALRDDQARGAILDSIPAELIAEWLMRQIWMLAQFPPARGWTDSALLRYVQQFVVPGIVVQKVNTPDSARMMAQLEQLQKDISLIKEKITSQESQPF